MIQRNLGSVWMIVAMLAVLRTAGLGGRAATPALAGPPATCPAGSPGHCQPAAPQTGEAAQPHLATVGPIAVGVKPTGGAADDATNKIYTANTGGNSVSVIDGANPSATPASISVAGTPWAFVVDPVTDTIYVANRNANTVAMINGATSTVTTTIPVGNTPLSVSVDAATNMVYVANSVDHSAWVIDGASNTVTATIPAGQQPEGIAVDAGIDTIYVANYGDNSASVIDGPRAVSRRRSRIDASRTKLGLSAIRGLFLRARLMHEFVGRDPDRSDLRAQAHGLLEESLSALKLRRRRGLQGGDESLSKGRNRAHELLEILLSDSNAPTDSNCA